ncbi:MAG: tRNA lysidine(34) synthetase TilS [Micromonosporaceae bacterium]|jgi:tRNA(Ile)-lysidine synthase
MSRVAPAVAAVRTAVRKALRDAAPSAAPPPPPSPAPAAAAGPLALVACSGGADSMALAEAAGFVGARLGWRVGLVTVDHGLQDGSRARAESVAAWARRAGFAPVEVLPVTVSGRGGPEAAARDARYRALTDAARRLGASAVLLGHTRDDQAETVLLALARGAGPRGLAGMPARRERDGVLWLRPLLSVRRDQTRAACAALGLEYWEDPHNTDPAYARARVRTTALPALVAALGDRVVDNLARTAELVAADDAALTRWAERVLADLPATDRELPVAGLRELPAAVRTRVLHAWARSLGVPGAALSHRHVAALDALVSDWHGQGPAYLPGGRVVRRRGDRLLAEPPRGGATAGGQV